MAEEKLPFVNPSLWLGPEVLHEPYGIVDGWMYFRTSDSWQYTSMYAWEYYETEAWQWNRYSMYTSKIKCAERPRQIVKHNKMPLGT